MAITGTAGQTQNFSYQGSVQAYTVPVDGVYKLEVWGAPGGKHYQGSGGFLTAEGGKGGYSVGYRILSAGTKIYVCVGQVGSGNTNDYLGESFNGGGAPGSGGGGAIYGGASGGGATHIAAVTGTLAQIGAKNLSQIFIVAGGGGGGGHNNIPAIGAYVGGAGGGTTGAAAGGADGGGGGSQSSGGSGYNSGTFGKGGTGAAANVTGGGGAGSGGGGGLYGGGGYNAGGGGSGYIGGVPSFSLNGVSYKPSMQQGGSSLSVGQARLTYMAPSFIPMYYNDTHLQHVVFNGTTLDHLVYDGQTIYCQRFLRGFKRGIGQMKTGGARLCLA